MEYGVRMTLESSYGTLYLNKEPALSSDATSYIHLSKFDGADGADLRFTSLDIPQRDGSVVYDSFEGSKTLAMEGVLMSATRSGRAALARELRAHARALSKSSGTLKFWTSDYLAGQQMTVRLADRLTVQGSRPTKEFLLPLVAEDPRIYSQTQQSQDTEFVLAGGGGGLVFPATLNITFAEGSSDGAGTFTNGGDAPSYPVVQIHGPITSPVLRNVTTGKTMFINSGGLSIAAGSYAEVDMLNETIRLNGSASQPLVAYVNELTSSFWPLEPGANTIRLSGDNPSGTTTMARVIWRDAWS